MDTITPSLVMFGDPHFLSSTTLRPLGPSVAVTAFASLLTPRKTAMRAVSSNTSCFAAIISVLSSLRLAQPPHGLREVLSSMPYLQSPVYIGFKSKLFIAQAEMELQVAPAAVSSSRELTGPSQPTSAGGGQ